MFAGSSFLCCSECLGAVFLIFVALRTGLEIDGFGGRVSDPKGKRVVMVHHLESAPALQTLIAYLQIAVSGQMTAEKQPT